MRPLSRNFLLAIAILICFGSTPATAATQERPNILLILLDNTGWGDFGCYGGGALRGAPSPRIDKLASEGVLLQNFNTEPQCTPSRSALMTGRHAIRSGTQSVPVGIPYYGLVPWEKKQPPNLELVPLGEGVFRLEWITPPRGPPTLPLD